MKNKFVTLILAFAASLSMAVSGHAQAVGKTYTLSSGGYSDSLNWSHQGSVTKKDTIKSTLNDTSRSVLISGAKAVSATFTKRDKQGTAGGQCSLLVVPQISNDNVNFADVFPVFSRFLTTETTATTFAWSFFGASGIIAATDTLETHALAPTGSTAAGQSAGDRAWATREAWKGAKYLRFRVRSVQGALATPYASGTLDTLFLTGVVNVNYDR